MALFLQLSPIDNVVVALSDLENDFLLILSNEKKIKLKEAIPAKHKVAVKQIVKGEKVLMYGIEVGIAIQDIAEGSLIHTFNVKHSSAEPSIAKRAFQKVELSKPPSQLSTEWWGYKRADGKVGSRNYWLLIPTVFCENINLHQVKEILDDILNLKPANKILLKAKDIASNYGFSLDTGHIPSTNKQFHQLDGIQVLAHQGGCGGTRADSKVLLKVFLAYVQNPNVIGATFLHLGCEHIDFEELKAEIETIKGKQFCFIQQQQLGKQEEVQLEVIAQTLKAISEIDKNLQREKVPIASLCLGLKCGGSDGFSGLSANPALGLVSDWVVAQGGKSILAEFPELCGVEQEIINRCENEQDAERFIQLMNDYAQAASLHGTGFDMNPSPGNIKDGLITDAMKSAGAAKKAGNAHISGVYDYAEPIHKAGLHLVCTPGNDVEATTGLAAAGANISIFTTGLGTPTGNNIHPVMKVSTNNTLNLKMPDVIDANCGEIITGTASIEEVAIHLYEKMISIASGEKCKAEENQQFDFIPWKRGLSL